MNPPSEWITKDVPGLRIIDDELWQTAKARQEATRGAMKTGIVRARRPKYLFSGLTRCEVCGGGFNLHSQNFLVCFNAQARGTCSNRRRIKRQEVEARVLRAMRERFFEPGAFAAFCEGFTAELTAQRRERLVQKAGARRELATVEHRQKQILNALAEGFRTEAWKIELLRLDEQKAALTHALVEPPLPAIHPNMAAVFRQKTTVLAAGLENDADRDAARQGLRGFLDQIVIPPGEGLLRVVGNVGAMLEAAQGRVQDRQAVVCPS